MVLDARFRGHDCCATPIFLVSPLGRYTIEFKDFGIKIEAKKTTAHCRVTVSRV